MWLSRLCQGLAEVGLSQFKQNNRMLLELKTSLFYFILIIFYKMQLIKSAWNDTVLPFPFQNVALKTAGKCQSKAFPQ